MCTKTPRERKRQRSGLPKEKEDESREDGEVEAAAEAGRQLRCRHLQAAKRKTSETSVSSDGFRDDSAWGYGRCC